MPGILAMDKPRSKLMFREFGLPTPEFGVATTFQEAQDVAKSLTYPLAVKPACEGSSVGVTRVGSSNELLAAFDKAVDRCIFKKFKRGAIGFTGHNAV